MISGDFRHGKLIEDLGHSQLRRTSPAPLVTLLLTCTRTCVIRLERLKMSLDIYILWPLRLSRVNTASSERNQKKHLAHLYNLKLAGKHHDA